MAQPDTRTKLRRALRTVSEGIRASEQWHDAYKRDPEMFKKLLMLESELQLKVADYLHDFSERAPAYVDWSHYMQLAADSSPLFNKSDAVWDGERLDMTRAVIDALTSLVALGGEAAALRYEIPLVTTALDVAVLEAARKQTARLVSGVTETSRDLLRAAIRQSIESGESADLAIERIRRVINNPVRAEMIAQTESVTAYQTGQYNFALETGAKQKTWEALAGACRICSPLDGETVAIDKNFSSGASLPPGHPRCRCGVYYHY